MTDSQATHPRPSSSEIPAPRFDPSGPGRAAAARRSWAMLALFGVLSAIFLNDAIRGGAYLLRDLLTFFHPWQIAARDLVRGGHLPLWNPATYCGVPLLANLQSGVFYPPNWLYWALPFDRALTIGMLLHLTMAGWLLRGFLRRTGLGERGAFLGGALFAYGTWTLAYLEFPMKLGSIAWIPMVWSGVWDASWGERRRGLFLAAAGVALSILAGYPQLAMLGFLSTTVLALLLAGAALRDRDATRRQKLHRVMAWPTAVAIGGLVAAAQLLPAAEMTALSDKADPYPAEIAMSRSLPPKALIGLVDPFFLGLPGVDRYWGGEIGEFCFGAFYVGLLALPIAAVSVATLKRRKRKRRVRREDMAVTDPGPVVPRLVTAFLWIGLVIGVLLALGKHGPVYPFLHAHVPGFGRTRWPSTAGVLIALHLAPLAGIGLEWLLRDRLRVRRMAIAALVLGFATLASWFVARGPGDGLFRAVQLADTPPYQAAVREAQREAWLGALVLRGGIVVAAGAIGLLVGEIRSRAATAWTALLLLDLFLVGRQIAPPVEAGFYDREPASVVALRDELDGARVYTPRSVDQLGNLLYGSRNPEAFAWAQEHLLCNANVPYGIAQAQGCEPLHPRRHDAFAQAFDAPGTPHALRERLFDLWDAGALLGSDVRPVDVATLTEPLPPPHIARHEPALGRATLLSGWETFDDGRAVLDRLLSPGHDPARRVLLEGVPGEPAPPEPRAGTGRAERVPCEYAPNAIRVAWHVGDGGVLRVLESWAPGWRATVNGEPVPVWRADFLFLAVPVPAGSCEVQLEYRPASVPRGLAMSALGLILLALVAIPNRKVAPTRSGSGSGL